MGKLTKINNEIAIITPTHKSNLDSKEVKRLKISLANNPGTIHYFALPESANVSQISKIFPNSKLKFFQDSSFASIDEYNVLLLQPNFYQTFSAFKGILILQTDAILIRDISDIRTFGFDYIGASWKPHFAISNVLGRLYVNRKVFQKFNCTIIEAGNGGLSYRDISAMIAITRYLKSSVHYSSLTKIGKRRINEDLALCYFGRKLGYKFPNEIEANNFFLEKFYGDVDQIPKIYGFHALEKHNPIVDSFLIN